MEVSMCMDLNGLQKGKRRTVSYGVLIRELSHASADKSWWLSRILSKWMFGIIPLVVLGLLLYTMNGIQIVHRMKHYHKKLPNILKLSSCLLAHFIFVLELPASFHYQSETHSEGESHIVVRDFSSHSVSIWEKALETMAYLLKVAGNLAWFNKMRIVQMWVGEGYHSNKDNYAQQRH